jgi:hypothetical protein
VTPEKPKRNDGADALLPLLLDEMAGETSALLRVELGVERELRVRTPAIWMA